MVYACLTWEYAADTYLSKMQRLQNKVRRTNVNLDRRTLFCDVHVDFKIPYVYD